ncbi:MAG TPA: DNA topoisomerase [Polyangia bacterium]|nr:DNA topoisomerase [Polyangia bacterium]
MQLVIAEKPSVARDLARVLGVRAKGRNSWQGEGRVITWCIGHLVELEEPAAYDARWKAWRLDTLPMVPPAFRLRAVTATRDQLRAVRELLRDRRFQEVVNGCDAGREGELIFRYVYELAGSRLSVRRLWISSLTDEAIRQGFAALRPGAQYDGLADAARCRSEADWLVGMNATRAVTIRFRQGDAGAQRDARPPVYSIGRVQTPTLAIIVRREQAIRGFRPTDYWEVRGSFVTAAPASESFTALWTARPDPDKRAFTRLGRRELADTVLARAGDHASATDPAGPIVERLVQKRTREPPPQLFDLTSLQRTANRRFGLPASRTLEAAQALYERHKVLTYPRTDSRHLPDDLAGEVPKLFAGLAKIPAYAPFAQPLLGGAPPVPARARRIFDPSKVQDHHAIIPTGRVPGPGALSQDEARIFDLVARRFLGAFHPDAEFASTEAVIRVGAAAAAAAAAEKSAAPDRAAPPALDAAAPDEAPLAVLPPPPDRFVARGRVCLVSGWRTVAGLDDAAGGKERDKDKDKESDQEARLPVLAQGQRLDGRFESLARQTRPPPRHSEATLLAAMESAGREIEDEALRAAMKDTGLGTPATRAATIETLLKRRFIAREGKLLVPTTTGIALIERLPVPTLASPELTGAWEERLARIARGQDTRAAFMADIVRYVRDVTDAIRGATRGGIAQPPPAPARAVAATSPEIPAAAAAAVPELLCPRCRQGKLLAGKRGWGCARWREGCAFVIWFEVAGKPLSSAQLRDLVEKGKTRKGKWPQPDGAPLAGHLVLDLVAAREHGAARFVPG